MPLLTEDLHWNQISSQQFLFARTDAHPAPSDPEPADLAEMPFAGPLLKKFPHALSGEAFLTAAMEFTTNAASFAVVVARVDNSHQVIAPDQVMLLLGTALDKMCRKTTGIWGITAPDALGCFFPEKNEKQCRIMVDALKRHLAKKGPETVSVGMAVHPTPGFEKGQILDNARKALDHAEFFGPGSCVAFDAVSLNISGDKYYQAGNIEAAVREFHLALALDPDNVNVHNSLGVCFGVQNELDKALDEFRMAARLAPKEIMAVYNAGYVYFLKKEYDTALEYFLRAERMDASVFEINIQTGRIYLELNQPENAKKYLETATARNPKSAAAFRLLGDAYTLLDRPTDAITAYKTALKLNPDNAEAISALGYLYEMQGKNAEIALMFCRQAVQTAPDNGLFHHRLGRLYLNRSMMEEALDAFQKARERGHASDEYIAKTLKMISAAG